MSARLLLLAALAAALFAASATAQDGLPTHLRYIPPDAAAFLNLDVAAIYDSKLGDAFKNTKSDEVKEKLASLTALTGLTPADVKTVTFVYPDLSQLGGPPKGLSVVTFRKKYDPKVVRAALEAEAKKAKGEFGEKDGIVTVITPSPFDVKNRWVTTTDLTNPTRVVTLNGLGDEYLKHQPEKGMHAQAIRREAGAAVLAGVNFSALPDELRMDNLPAEFRPFQPLVAAEGLLAVGNLDKDKFTLTLTVTSKKKENAAEVEKSLDAGRTLLTGLLASAKKDTTTYADPKAVGELLDIAATALKDVKFAVDGKTTTATASIPTDTKLGPLVEVMLGGGLSARMVTQNNLKQLGIAVYNYEAAHGVYPAPASLGKKGKKLLSWRVEMLPYLEQESLYKQFKLDEPWDSEHNRKVFKDNPMPKVFAIPGTNNLTDKKTHFQVFVGNGAMFDHAGAFKVTDIADGTTNTILVATAADAVEWTKPDDIEFDSKADVLPKLLVKDNAIQVAMGDGTVRALSAKMKEKPLKALVTRNGGEVVGADDDK